MSTYREEPLVFILYLESRSQLLAIDYSQSPKAAHKFFVLDFSGSPTRVFISPRHLDCVLLTPSSATGWKTFFQRALKVKSGPSGQSPLLRPTALHLVCNLIPGTKPLRFPNSWILQDVHTVGTSPEAISEFSLPHSATARVIYMGQSINKNSPFPSKL